jgi:hypothetical protein
MTRRKRALIVLSLFGVGAVLAVTRWPLQLPSVCLFKRITGLPCCGCGMTHAFCAMAHGQFEDAANFNLAAVPLAMIVLVSTALLIAEAIDDKPHLDPVWKKTRKLIVWAGGPILLISWIINLTRVFMH